MAGCGEAPAPASELDAVLSTITPGTLGTHRDYLADDALEGRLTGTAGYDAAARYVAERFDSYGLAPGGEEDWYQQVPLQTYRLDTDSTRLVAHRDGGDQELVYRKQYAMLGDVVRETTSVRAEVVYAGFGVHAPDFGYSDYEGVDVDGRIIAIFDNAPPVLPHNERAYYASSSTKYREAVKRGAVGIIALRSRHAEASNPWERIEAAAGTKPAMTWLAEDGRADDYYPQLQGGALLSAAAAEEFFSGTPLSFEEALDATEASRVASVPLGFELTLARNTQHEEIASPNVIGVVRGSDAALADEFILYTAHLDGLGRGVAVDGDEIYNGAYDNATGVALLLETARVFALHPPRRSVMFLAVTAEENGLLGSDYFAHYPTVPIDAIVANINLDMPLFLVPIADVVAFGAEHSSLEHAVAEAAHDEGFVLTPDPMPEEVIFIRSDQYSLVRQGVPAIFLVPGFSAASGDVDGAAAFREFLGQHYHRPSDELSLPVDWDSAVRFTRTNARIGYITGNADARPSWNAGDFFGEMFGQPP
jgi:Zn-dependent M28 family amino/carboxypeptidase